MPRDDASSDGEESSIQSSAQSDRPPAEVEDGLEEEDMDALEMDSKGIMDVVFYTIYTLNSSSTYSRSRRLAIFKVAVEFLQVFRIVLTVAFRTLSNIAANLAADAATAATWTLYSAPALAIADVWVLKVLNIFQFRMLVVQKGYGAYIAVLYIISGLVASNVSYAVIIALMLKHNKKDNYFTRWKGTVQMFAKMIYTIWYPAILDYLVSPFSCTWMNLAHGAKVHHLDFPDKNCLALPHLGHMLVSAVVCILFCGLTLLMALGACDMNPMTRSVLASSDTAATLKIMAFKVCLVIVSSALNGLGKPQAVFMLIFALAAVHHQSWQVPHYSTTVNIVWTGLMSGTLAMTCLVVALDFAPTSNLLHAFYAQNIIWAMLYCTLPILLLSSMFIWLRMRRPRQVTAHMQKVYLDLRHDECAVEGSPATQALTALETMSVAELRSVYKFRDAMQVSLVCRGMRRWDEDDIADPVATGFGEFVLKCGMARLQNNPTLLVLYASFLIGVHKDGQGATNTLQQAQKAKPSLLDRYNMYVAQQLAKGLMAEDGGLDLLGYVEYQRKYRACVRVHKLALMAQRQFWQCILRPAVSLTELQAAIRAMERREARATDTYRRVLERYPGNGKLLKIYGRFLEYVRDDPSTAAKYYEEAVKLGVADSLLGISKGVGLSGAGIVNEKVDGLVIINDQGGIMMINAAAVAMFEYDKGELEGKNVSVLMPPPVSAMHAGFIKRYMDTGKPHLLNQTRPMVAVTKNRSTFPIDLYVTRLKTNGSEALFMGVIRRSLPASSQDQNIARFWTTGTGIILCADSSTADSFGFNAADLVGQPFGNLCTQVENVNKFLLECSRANTVGAQLQVQMLHAYLPPVNVELTTYFGGAINDTHDCRNIIIQATVLSECSAVMALDQGGRITYANDKLAAMLGYPATALVKMDLSALLPPLISQLHGTWFKDLSRKPPYGSCRAGGVVQMMTASGNKVPVTLRMSSREHVNLDGEDSGGMMHVVQVTKAHATELLDQGCLQLKVNHKGIILNTNPGAPKALYGFDGAELVGRPLAAVVDVFGLWRLKFGEDSSLLSMLAFQAIDESDSAGGLKGLHAQTTGSSWRVGVHQPVQHDEDIVEHARHLAVGAGLHDVQLQEDAEHHAGSAASNFLRTIQQKHKTHPARMSVALLEKDAEVKAALDDEAVADSTPVLQVSLHRSDGLAAILELDHNLLITHAEDTAALILGAGVRQLYKKPLLKFLELPATTTFEDLLGTKAAAKSALKTTAGSTGAYGVPHVHGSVSMGQARKFVVHHFCDSQPLCFELQAMQLGHQGSTRRLVRLRVTESSSASMCALMQRKAALSAAGTTGVVPAEGAAAAAAEAAQPDNGGDSRDTAAVNEIEDNLEAFMSPERTSDWVLEASTLHSSPDQPVGGEASSMKPPASTSSSSRAAAALHEGDHGAVYMSIKLKSNTSKSEDDDSNTLKGAAAPYRGNNSVHADEPGNTPRWPRRSSEGFDEAGASYRPQRAIQSMDSADEGLEEVGYQGYEASIPAPRAGTAGWAGAEAASDPSAGGGGGSDVGSEAAGGSVSSATDADNSEDLAVDARRAKRLKKLKAMLNSSLAQQAFNSWRWRTLLLLAVIVIAHIVGFGVLENEIASRRLNAEGVADMGRALDRMQVTTLRVSLMQKCFVAEFINSWTCSPERLALYASKLALNIDLANTYHKKLYLGDDKGGKPHTFQDERLLDYWTFKRLPEVQFYPETFNGTNVFANSSRTLWEMGNVFLSAARDVLFTGYSGDPRKMNESVPWQYTYNNGQGSLFFGYAWSLDTYIDTCTNSLLVLGGTLIILLVVEAVIVQLSCMAYEFYLLQQCNTAHMRMFSVFLALPSAAVRLMAARQLPVDDDIRDEAYSEDEMGGDGMAAEQLIETGPGDAEQRKSVRMAAGLEDDSHQGPGKQRTETRAKSSRWGADSIKRHSTQNSWPGAASGGSKSSSKHGHKPAGPGAWLYKLLFGWLDPKFKMNGKKLVTNSTVLWRFMVPLLFWLIAVVVIFGVLHKNLSGLQGPLASLDVAVHVQYHLGRCRLAATNLAFSDSHAISTEYKLKLKLELSLLQQEYDTLLFGGPMRLMANVSFNPVAPASVYMDAALSNLFFSTKDCLRADRSTCFTEDSPYYTITHSGIDPMIKQYIEKMTYFANLPDDQALANNSAYVWVQQVIANDGYDAMNTAIETFISYNLHKLDAIERLHIILLVVSLACMMLFLVLLYRPYIKQLRQDSKAVVGMLSQLPAEVDVEGHVKAIVLGIAPRSGAAGSQSNVSLASTFSAGMWSVAQAGSMTAGILMPPGVYATNNWAGPTAVPVLQQPNSNGAGYTNAIGMNDGRYGRQRTH